MGLIRFLLAISVLTAHCGPLFGVFNFVGGELAVQVFFIISGYYMSMVLKEKYSSGKKGYFLFLSNRFLRLYPIYWVILLLTLVGFLIKNQIFIDEIKNLNIWSGCYMIFTNIFIFFQDTVLFLGINSLDGNLYFTKDFWSSSPPLYHLLLVPQGWSIAIELMFYLIAPFLVKLSSKKIYVVIFLLIGFRLILYSCFNLKHDPWTYRFFPSELVFFMFGILSNKIENSKTFLAINPIFIQLILTLFIIIYLFIPQIKSGLAHFSINALVLFILVSLSLPVLFKFYKKSKWDRYIGELSYPIYISHMFILYISQALDININNVSEFVVFVSILISMLIIKFISDPIEKIRQKRVFTFGQTIKFQQ